MQPCLLRVTTSLSHSIKIVVLSQRRRKLHIACDDFFMLRIKSHLALIPLLLLSKPGVSLGTPGLGLRGTSGLVMRGKSDMINTTNIVASFISLATTFFALKRGASGLGVKREGGNRSVPAFAPLQFFVSVLLFVVQLFGPLERVHAVEAYRFPAFFTEKTADVFRPIPADAARDGVQAPVVERAERVGVRFSVHRVIPLPFVLL